MRWARTWDEEHGLWPRGLLQAHARPGDKVRKRAGAVGAREQAA